MTHIHGLTLTTVNLSAPDPGALARFYQQLLGWKVGAEEPDWVLLRDPEGGVGLAFQSEPHYVRPVWPAGPGDPQMMVHLEIRVDDLEGAGAHATACGATLADYQPQDDVRVYLDPAGHPFCLWLG
jgi:catechol 2,3-dioxygenase-like lactoylglutathione lyase family enzyme